MDVFGDTQDLLDELYHLRVFLRDRYLLDAIQRSVPIVVENLHLSFKRYENLLESSLDVQDLGVKFFESILDLEPFNILHKRRLENSQGPVF